MGNHQGVLNLRKYSNIYSHLNVQNTYIFQKLIYGNGIVANSIRNHYMSEVLVNCTYP